MKLREIIAELESMESQYALREIHIEYLKEQGQLEEAQEQEKDLVKFAQMIKEFEETEWDKR